MPTQETQHQPGDASIGRAVSRTIALLAIAAIRLIRRGPESGSAKIANSCVHLYCNDLPQRRIAEKPPQQPNLARVQHFMPADPPQDVVLGLADAVRGVERLFELGIGNPRQFDQ